MTRTHELLAFILKLYKHSTALEIIKRAYLTDYIAFQKNKKTITGLKYLPHTFGVWDKGIYVFLDRLVIEGIVHSHISYTKNGHEYVHYAFNDILKDLNFKDRFMPSVSLAEFYLVRDILYSLFYYTEKDLTRMIYNSKPFKLMGIQQGGVVKLGEEIQF